MRGDPRTIDDAGACDSEDDDENWMPAPSDADPGTCTSLFITTYIFRVRLGLVLKFK